MRKEYDMMNDCSQNVIIATRSDKASWSEDKSKFVVNWSEDYDDNKIK